MNRKIYFLSFILLLINLNASAEVSFSSLLKPLRDLSSLANFRNYTTHQFSSYDRSGGNGDAQNFLGKEGNTAVLAEMKGPGAIVRIWSANAGNVDRLRIYLDDRPQPVIDLPFLRLFDGSTPPFLPPLSCPSSGGFISYLPMPYAKSCRVTVENPRGLYYHITYISFPPTTRVRTFRLPLRREEEKELQKVIEFWNHPGPRENPPYSREKEILAGEQAVLKELAGPATLRLLKLKIAPSQPEVLRKLVLRAFFDHHTSPDIEAPVSDFFGNAYGEVSFRNLLLGQKEEFYCLFPMPFAQKALFSLENGNPIPIKVSMAMKVVKSLFDPRRKGYFHARFLQEITRRGRPHRWLSLQGRRGHFVGVVQAMRGRGLGFLEGDEQFRVDEEQWLPSQISLTQVAPWNGTGTEDYFNSGWYFNQGPVILPSHGALVRKDKGEISAYRWHINDTPTFRREITAQIEHGGANDAPGTYYASVVYWYDNGEVPPIFPSIQARDLKLPELPNLP